MIWKEIASVKLIEATDLNWRAVSASAAIAALICLATTKKIAKSKFDKLSVVMAANRILKMTTTFVMK